VIISVPKESAPGEQRVALTPDVVKRLVKQGVEVRVERDAGLAASHADADYEAAGATIAADANAAWQADIVLRVGKLADDEVGRLREGSILVGMLYPLTNPRLAKQLADRKVTSFSLDQLPRITRAQAMDVLSSMSTIAGYRAVLMSAATSGKFFQMLVTAAGTIAPSKVFVLGAGVAGLQAIATAKRLGAVVSAFDVRPAVKEQVESLGAKFVSPEADLSAEGEGGYAKELSEDQHKKELEFIGQHAKDMDVIITTALIPGKPAPELITEDALKGMRHGAVIVDLAAEMGGNCKLTEAGKTVEKHGVTLIGPLNLPAGMPVHASQMYSKNIVTLVSEFIGEEGAIELDFENDVVGPSTVTHQGEIVNERVKDAVGA